MITSPKVLFMDEPTSGLDSSASYEIISYLKRVAKKNKVRWPTISFWVDSWLIHTTVPLQLIVIASIHQPSTATFQLFDKLLLLSKGRTCYFGRTADTGDYFDSIGLPFPINTNPAEYLLDLVSTDFAHDDEANSEKKEQISSASAVARLEHIQTCWEMSSQAQLIHSQTTLSVDQNHAFDKKSNVSIARPTWYRIVFSLLHRSFIKSNRDIVTYGIRIAMYLGEFIILHHSISNILIGMMYRPRHYDGNCLVAYGHVPGIYPAFHQCHRKWRAVEE